MIYRDLGKLETPSQLAVRGYSLFQIARLLWVLDVS